MVVEGTGNRFVGNSYADSVRFDDAAIAERIFEPYARFETQTARGSGIGLYAAKRLAETMGSRLWSEPALSGGARFVLAMPAALAV